MKSSGIENTISITPITGHSVTVEFLQEKNQKISDISDLILEYFNQGLISLSNIKALLKTKKDRKRIKEIMDEYFHNQRNGTETRTIYT